MPPEHVHIGSRTKKRWLTAEKTKKAKERKRWYFLVNVKKKKKGIVVLSFAPSNVIATCSAQECKGESRQGRRHQK